ncbi:MAG: hypothetical protein AB7E47_13040 [Desulfovibrionaceae bacterium]
MTDKQYTRISILCLVGLACASYLYVQYPKRMDRRYDREVFRLDREHDAEVSAMNLAFLKQQMESITAFEKASLDARGGGAVGLARDPDVPIETMLANVATHVVNEHKGTAAVGDHMVRVEVENFIEFAVYIDLDAAPNVRAAIVKDVLALTRQYVHAICFMRQGQGYSAISRDGILKYKDWGTVSLASAQKALKDL